MSDIESPKVFVSYSWSSPDHVAWVLQLAKDLTEAGITPVIDKWELHPGEDAGLFMERMVNDATITKVIMVCDPIYKVKADSRQGGAGTEAQILSAELYRSASNSKFCAVIAQMNEEETAPIPTYYASRLYIDLSDEAQRSEKLEELVRWIFNKPALTRPPIGPRPSYLNDDANGFSLGTATRARRALDAIKTHKPFWKSACREYFELVASQFEVLRIKPGDAYAEDFVRNIKSFLPCRNEILEVIRAIAGQELGADSYEVVHRFLERLLPYTVPPEGTNSWIETEFDNFNFLIYELFMLVMANLVKHENFEFAEALLRDSYIMSSRNMTGEMTNSFEIFQDLSMRTLENISRATGVRKISYRAFLLGNRLADSGVAVTEVAQADLVIAIRARAMGRFWWPDNLVHAERHRTMVLFARCMSSRFFQRVSAMLGTDLKGLISLAKKIDDDGGFFRGIGYFGPNVSALIGEDKLCSAP